MKLKNKKIVEVAPLPPFNFDATFHKPDHFTSGDNIWQSGIKWQTWRWKGKTLGLKIIDVGGIDKPRISVEIYSHQEIDQELVDSVIGEVKYRYNLDLDLSGFYKSLEKDKLLLPIIEKWEGMRPGQPSSLYEYLIIGIVLQNATVRRSIQMFGNLLQKYGSELEYNGQKLWCFWEEGGLEKASEEELRNLKVGYRAKSIKKIDDSFSNGQINELELRKKSLEEQRKILLNLYGVGPATVWYLLFDVFHHFGHFDHVSPWEQKIYSKLFFDKDPENPVPVDKILKYFERYGEYKQLAVHYIWEDLWWKRKNEKIEWLEKLIRI